MSLIVCPDCGRSVSDAAAACIHCGRPIARSTAEPVSPMSPVPTPEPQPIPQRASATKTATEYPLFSVSTQKFIVLSICTFSIYELYWCYQNWVKLQSKSTKDMRPFWRAFFAPLWNFRLFGIIRDMAASKNVAVSWSAGVLGTLYLVLSLLWRLPDPWWWISLASLLALVPVQQTAQRINRLYVAEGERLENDTYSKTNIVTIVLGSLLVILAVVGTFIPE